MDKEGYIQITGRIKDLIIRGGENIRPLEIENCILGHPDVANVSVVGLSDERYGEIVAAFIIKKAASTNVTEERIRKWVTERLSRHLGEHDRVILCSPTLIIGGSFRTTDHRGWRSA